MKRSRQGFALLILCLLPAAASAAVIPIGDSGVNYVSDAALLPGGGFAVVWSWSETFGPDGDADVRMQWVRPDGSFVFPEAGLTVAGSPRLVEAQAVLAPHPSSGVFVAFVRYEDDIRSEVVVQRYDGNGRKLWPGFGVVAAPEPGLRIQALPILVPDGGGGVYVCFNSLPNDGSGRSDVLCQHLDQDGRRLWPLRGLQPGGYEGVHQPPHGVPDGEGGLLLVWGNGRVPAAGLGRSIVIEGQRFAADGTRLWGRRGKVIHRTRIASLGGSFADVHLEVVSDGQGGAVVATAEGRDGLDVVAQRVSRDGHNLWGSGTVVASSRDAKFLTGLVAGPGGGAFVLYADQHFKERRYSLAIQRLDGAGQRVWEVRELAPGEAQGFGVGDFDGSVLRVVWARFPSWGESLSEIRLLELDLDGDPLNGAAGEALAEAEVFNLPRKLVYDPVRGEGLVIWNGGGSRERSAGALFDGH